MARKSAFMTGGSLANVLVGVGFQLLLAQQLGVSEVSDRYFLGTMAPTLIATILIGSAPSVLVPSILAKNQPKVSLADYYLPTLMLSVPVVLLFVLQPHISSLFTDDQPQQLTSVARTCLLACPLAWFASIFQSISIARERFIVVGLSGAVNGAALLLTAVVYFSMGISSQRLAICFVVGYAVQAAVQLIAVRSDVEIKNRQQATELDGRRALSTNSDAKQKSLTRNIAILFSSAILYKSQPLVERSLSSIFDGGPSIIAYGEKITQAALLASTLGLALISLPQISKAVAAGKIEEGRALSASVATYVAGFAAPFTVVGFLHSREIVRILYLRGAFDPADVESVSALIRVAMVGVAFSAVAGPLVNFQYATGHYGRAAATSIGTTSLGIAASVLFRPTYGLPGVVAGGVLTLLLTYAIFSYYTVGNNLARLTLLHAQIVSIFCVTIVGASLISMAGEWAFPALSSSIVQSMLVTTVTMATAAACSAAVVWLIRGSSTIDAIDDVPKTKATVGE
ncbi:lipid II flippase MurJ [Rhodococcus sp. IEGM 1341]|uniref:lipid II flippase MurJ n=1 Tax=Rhodococcus sp. IEGM 1341 TaxID=3047090 RepID=UPI0024B69ED5|nr:lipid II flippase MurJ [Rhodococcus sp. IEGM 1341]MDI9926232.1 lipid II flippase MurJ [Rhodococcus sp. IEGM 1341]